MGWRGQGKPSGAEGCRDFVTGRVTSPTSRGVHLPLPKHKLTSQRALRKRNREGLFLKMGPAERAESHTRLAVMDWEWAHRTHKASEFSGGKSWERGGRPEK